jgi:hypothetical protein
MPLIFAEKKRAYYEKAAEHARKNKKNDDIQKLSVAQVKARCKRHQLVGREPHQEKRLRKHG